MTNSMKKSVLFALIFTFAWCPRAVFAQGNEINGLTLGSEIKIKADTDYEIGGIQVKGADQLDPTMVGLLSGINVGDKVQFPSVQALLLFHRPLTNPCRHVLGFWP